MRATLSLDDPFLKSLANGGFQVGELAKCYYPGGIEIEGMDYEKTWLETVKQLEQPNVILFEAAIKFENLFVRVDILKKSGNKIELIEVKSKSFNSKTFIKDMWLKQNEDKLNSSWVPYVYDIAFQAYVLKKAFPSFEVTSFLMCSDKDQVASVDGLNQKFLISKDGRQTKIKITGDVSLESLGTPILTAVDITEAITKIHNDVEATEIYKDKGFEESIKIFSDAYSNDKKIPSEVGKHCKGCDFRTNHETLKSGFNECWKLSHGLTDEELTKPFSFDVWYGPKVPEERIFMEDIELGDFAVKVQDPGIDGLTRSQRQWLGFSDQKVTHKCGLKITIKQDKRPEILKIDEIKNLLYQAKAQDHDWNYVWSMALLTGMRNCELYALKWNDVDLDNGTIKVERSYNFKLNEFKDTKAGYWRTVPISSELKSLLLEIRLNSKSEFVLPRFELWKDGKQAQILKHFCKSIGLPEIKFHTLRACFATQLIGSGVEPVKVMKICGWKDLKTLAIYLRLAGVEEKGVTEGLRILPKEDGNVLSINF